MKIHFIGIGGIGVSALAQYYLAKGHKISGSDLVSSEITDFLKEKEMTIMTGPHLEKNITEDIDMVIYSPAVQKDNPEYKKAKEFGIGLKSYPEALGALTKEYYTIAVSGAHGKSTTTAMVALVLIKAGLDPAVIIGTKLKEFGGSNFRIGDSSNSSDLIESPRFHRDKAIEDPRKNRDKYLVVEACEYDDSFLNYSPEIIVVTNVDREHLDYFKNFKNVIKEFKKFILRLSEKGFLVANEDDNNLVKISKGKFTTKYYSVKNKEAAKVKKILKIPGQHNVSNALAALTVARILKIRDQISLKALSEYKGSWRRFEILKTKPQVVISDYGHHPNEILATLKSAREKYKNKKIWCVFQPHQYQRTHYLFKDFIKVFRQVPIDSIIITDIYDVAGREEKKISSSTSSENLVKKINRKNIAYMPIASAEKFVKENIKRGEVLIIMGAGDVYKLVDKF